MVTHSTDSKSLIFSAALAEFSEHGYAGARVARIAQRAGVNKQLIFYYFGSKAGLYEQVLSHAASHSFSPTPTGTPPGPAPLRAAVRGAFEQLGSSPELVSLVLGDAQRSGELARAAFDQLTAEIRGVVSAGQGLGHYRDDADPDVIARQAVVLMVGYFALESAAGGPAGRPAWVDGVCDTLAKAVAW